MENILFFIGHQITAGRTLAFIKKRMIRGGRIMNSSEEDRVRSDMLFPIQEYKQRFFFTQLHDVTVIRLFVDRKMTERPA